MNGQQLREWIGRVESTTDEVTTAPLRAMSATLDRNDPPFHRGDPVPPLWHWLYFLPQHQQSELGFDGHARLGGFLPSVPLPRRMYAGGRIDIHRALRVGETVSRISHIEDVREKGGRSGRLVFVTVRHDISDREGLAVSERQDIVYRKNPEPGDPVAPVQQVTRTPQWVREIHPDEVLLFRYSALTFNGHRIHYDRAFAAAQGYSGLVVHGPLLATLLADLLRRNLPHAAVSTFSFRAIRALFDTGPFLVCGAVEADGRTVTLWAQEPTGGLAVDATATVGGSEGLRAEG